MSRSAWLVGLDVVLVAVVAWAAWNVRAPIVHAAPDSLAGEEELYDRYAVPWARGEGTEPREKAFPWHPLGSITHRPSGYVVFVGIVYRLAGDQGVVEADRLRRLAAVRTVQAGMDSLTMALLYVLGTVLFGGLVGRAVGLTAAAVTLQYDFLAQFTARLLSETLFTFLTVAFVVAALAAARRGTPVGSGMAAYVLGWANIVRTFLLFALPGYLAWLAVGPELAHRRRHVLLASVGMAAALAPVVWRNWQFHGQFVLVSTNSGYTSYHGLQNVPSLSAPSELGTEEEVKALGLGEIAEQAEFRRRAVEYVRRHPGDWPRIVRHRVGVLVAAKGGHKISHVLMVTPDDEWLTPLLLAGALLSLVVQPRRSWHGRLLLWIVVGSQVATGLAAQAEVRYRVPLVPLLAILAAWAAWGAADWLVSTARRRAMAPA